ncbi:hypothetical protein EUGRSUZ_C01675 [Eucalyptus grandis]|uniref:Uncharacterized protein n=2 Tax=Eucalyptus grandis TaxID=71139 RepID=A0A059CPC5_EUCGR|nr:hypothetical protein EUGRSUZ_C01675 [Eucalyptus grandis]
MQEEQEDLEGEEGCEEEGVSAQFHLDFVEIDSCFGVLVLLWFDLFSCVVWRVQGRSVREEGLVRYQGALRCSLGVSRSWSAARQIQAIENNLYAPRGNEIVATNGLVVPVFTMNSVLLFMTWALVAAIPCQDCGLQAAPILSLHERIVEESKKRERRNARGLLREIHQIERGTRIMSELEEEVRQRVEDMAEVFDAVKDGLDPLEKQVREVFHRIVRSRTEGLDYIGRANRSE